jgi:hypothetical protein
MARMKPNGRHGGGASFVRFEHRLLDHPAFHALSPIAAKALLFMAGQYKGSNNGDLTIAWKIAKAKGLRSNDTLRRGTLELIEAGFIIQTRQGGRNRCSLFALAWFPIDECGGKLDISATRTAPIDWHKLGTLSEPDTVQLAARAVQSAQISPSNGVH